MKLSQIFEKSDKELDQLIAEKQQALSQLVIDMRTKKMTNVKEVASFKRSIAQALTIKRQREITILDQAMAKSQKPDEGDSDV